MLQHWNYFLTLEDDIGRLSRYLELTQANFSSYSLELARILFAAASEVDVVSKLLCKKIDADSSANNITKYRERLLASCAQIKGTGFTPFPRTVWLSLNPASDAFPAAFFFLGCGIARYSRRYLSVLQPGFDTAGDIFAPA